MFRSPPVVSTMRNGLKLGWFYLCVHTKNGARALLAKHSFHPFLTNLGLKGTFSRHFGIFTDPKRVTTGSRRAKNTHLSTRAVSWTTWLKVEFRGHLVHPQPPTFCGFQARDSPNETPRPPYKWSLGTAGGQPGLRTAGASRGSTKVPRAKKMIPLKVVPRPLGMLKHVFLARF